jgi:hypothetical protein
LLLGGLGLAAWLNRLRRRPPGEEASPADELRAKLAATRVADTEGEDDEVAEEHAGAKPDPDARRRDVHERARKSLDELS